MSVPLPSVPDGWPGLCPICGMSMLEIPERCPDPCPDGTACGYCKGNGSAVAYAECNNSKCIGAAFESRFPTVERPAEDA